jgi:hypothetical protein
VPVFGGLRVDVFVLQQIGVTQGEEIAVLLREYWPALGTTSIYSPIEDRAENNQKYARDDEHSYRN